VRVVTWSDCYVVDARGGGCNCPDKQYNEPGTCNHEYAARLFDGDTVDRPTVDDDLSTASAAQQVATDGGNDRPVDCECMDEYVDDDPLPCFPCVRDGFDVVNPNPPTDEDMVNDEGDTDPVAVADGGRTPAHHDEFLIADPDNEQYDAEDTRAEAEARLDTANEVPGVDAEIFPPGESPDFLWSRMRETYDDTETADETEPRTGGVTQSRVTKLRSGDNSTVSRAVCRPVCPQLGGLSVVLLALLRHSPDPPPSNIQSRYVTLLDLSGGPPDGSESGPVTTTVAAARRAPQRDGHHPGRRGRREEGRAEHLQSGLQARISGLPSLAGTHCALRLCADRAQPWASW